MKQKSFYNCQIILFIFFIIAAVSSTSAQIDTFHYSSVFNTNKPYRIFLPADYEHTKKKYPVIYYFHGNQGSHQLAVDGISQLVNDNGVILVAWDGRSAPSDMRP